MSNVAKRVLSNNIYKRLLYYRYLYKILTKNESYLVKTGYIKSFRNFEPLDSKGQPTPWMNYAFLDFLEPRLHKHLKVFEYGSGYSTIYFSDKVQSVYSVEFDEEWYNKVKEKLQNRQNCHIFYYPSKQEYINAFSKYSDLNFDVIIVDGRDRVECIKQIIDSLADHAVLILDDSWKEKFEETFLFMKNKGYKEISFSGIKAGSIIREQTTVFYKENNILDI